MSCLVRFWIANCTESCFSSKKYLILSIECSTYLGINQDNPGPSTTSSAQEQVLSSPPNLSRHLQSIRQLKASSGFLKSKVGRLKVERPRQQTRKCIYIDLNKWNEKERVLNLFINDLILSTMPS